MGPRAEGRHIGPRAEGREKQTPYLESYFIFKTQNINSLILLNTIIK